MVPDLTKLRYYSQNWTSGPTSTTRTTTPTWTTGRTRTIRIATTTSATSKPCDDRGVRRGEPAVSGAEVPENRGSRRHGTERDDELERRSKGIDEMRFTASPAATPRLRIAREPPLALRRIGTRLRVRGSDRHMVDARARTADVPLDAGSVRIAGTAPAMDFADPDGGRRNTRLRRRRSPVVQRKDKRRERTARAERSAGRTRRR